MTAFTALVLAGSRGEPDGLCAYAGVSHKGLIELGGQTLLTRVVTALSQAGATRIGISTSDPGIAAAVEAIPGPASVKMLPASPSPSLSVGEATRELGTPLLVTTVDHALLQAAWIEQFLKDVPPNADVAALVAPEAAIRAAAPDTERTYLRFRDGRYSGCNLFYLRNTRSLAVVELWRRIETHRKQPWRIAALLGPRILAGYALRRLTLDQMVGRLGEISGVTAAAVRTPYGMAAIDVDKPSDLDLARRLFAARTGL